jgi:S-adenosylmethionine:tRNA ribosyltransferase-isomerase
MTAPQFALPHELEAAAPPRRRDDVRLLVAAPGRIRHARFVDLPHFLREGDVIVVNISATLPAALSGHRRDGRRVTVHFAGELRGQIWLVEVRPHRRATGPVADLQPDESISLPHGGVLRLQAPMPAGQHRMWRAQVLVEGGVVAYLGRVGRPIRYSYVPRPHPISAYQTVFGRVPGSAEMPSAGRPFTAELVTELATRGALLAPITLHTGVSSPEQGEPPQPERFAVPAATAALVNHVRSLGARVVAVGTTVTRALESAADEDGTVHAAEGWTDLVLGPRRPARVVSGLVTGWHAPGASHLQLLQAVAGSELVEAAYAEALRARYRWHEFGDSCLLLP